jgi:hypothetical protein
MGQAKAPAQQELGEAAALVTQATALLERAGGGAAAAMAAAAMLRQAVSALADPLLLPPGR